MLLLHLSICSRLISVKFMYVCTFIKKFFVSLYRSINTGFTLEAVTGGKQFKAT